jgi:hypothetical protein
MTSNAVSNCYIFTAGVVHNLLSCQLHSVRTSRRVGEVEVSKRLNPRLIFPVKPQHPNTIFGTTSRNTIRHGNRNAFNGDPAVGWGRKRRRLGDAFDAAPRLAWPDTPTAQANLVCDRGSRMFQLADWLSGPGGG